MDKEAKCPVCRENFKEGDVVGLLPVQAHGEEGPKDRTVMSIAVHKTCYLPGSEDKPLRPADYIFPETHERRVLSVCPTCGKKIDPSEFRDGLSLKEFRISGMCQECQDKTFGGD